MPLNNPCANTHCNGYAPTPGGLCRECQQKADEQRQKAEANKWKHAGWTRQSERDTHSKYKPK
jgi:hypothetical protein